MFPIERPNYTETKVTKTWCIYNKIEYEK